jgi:hypothetical protein
MSEAVRAAARAARAAARTLAGLPSAARVVTMVTPVANRPSA